jgi:4-hydroxythreonine-4-phosphate dehydrogenase
MGEPAGIGPEIAVRAFAELGGYVRGRPLRLVGAANVFEACGDDVPTDRLIAIKSSARREPAKPDKANSAAVTEAIELATQLAMRGEAGAVVTAPISKAVLTEGDFRFSGHTEFLAHLTGAKKAVMMLTNGSLRVVPLTVHTALSSVPRLVSEESILETASIAIESLRKDFAIDRPRLVVSGLNPHAGESGLLGDEEARIISPAIVRLRKSGAQVLGPLPADTMFHTEARNRYDAAICMYHDQALIPIKALSFWTSVNVTLGLPIVRTSPDHGTAFDIAGTGRADIRSMVAAIELAAQMADARKC